MGGGGLGRCFVGGLVGGLGESTANGEGLGDRISAKGDSEFFEFVDCLLVTSCRGKVPSSMLSSNSRMS